MLVLISPSIGGYRAESTQTRQIRELWTAPKAAVHNHCGLGFSCEYALMNVARAFENSATARHHIEFVSYEN